LRALNAAGKMGDKMQVTSVIVATSVVKRFRPVVIIGDGELTLWLECGDYRRMRRGSRPLTWRIENRYLPRTTLYFNF